MFKYLNKVNIQGVLFICIIVCHISSHSQSNEDDYYIRFVDSADYYIDDYPKKAQAFLDSIPQPIEDKITGRVADYYDIKALIHDERGEYAQLYQSYILAIKYADKEKNYEVAGCASLELFANLYFAKKNAVAYKYLNKAKAYYELDNNTNGLLEVKQMYAYAEFSNKNYKKCNELILNNLETYKAVKDDAYFYMFATYMLTSNYIELGNLNKAYTYIKEFESLKDNSTIVKYNYASFKVSMDINFAEHYLKNKKLDSVSHYLSKASELRSYMGNDLVRKYFNLKADVYKSYGKIEEAKTYLDSIAVFERKMFDNNLEASFQLNNTLIKTESELESESVKKFWNGFLAVFLFCLLSFLSIFYLIYYRKHKWKLKDSINKMNNLSYLKSNNEKLTGKVLGLEEYILNLKKEVKEVSMVHDVPVQREKIKDLYKNLLHNSSTLLDKSENHLELVNELNVEFFNRIQSKYPQLNDSEVITCYYLFMDFKNKEIALFLNISVRALESKRYRISKKIDLNTKKNSLLEHLKETFKDTKIGSTI
ncbi:hypothetical protein CJ739_3811 [Mariniflexile rhizosphaerae]|uniref:helix-turn-helix transcriptional regulator n=1 Tax=unclassified Mariniflexile TaxID=2643887 RepID=UPI000CBB2C12|nr:hypothetical protein [Mariniflexile sp. TRM1-10]AXP82871.1 hypothetical protein CJ739_3811 [Mariniflexile sp. TRM1-10]PLB18218.1 MAG: Periplasmic ligand-binding sensor protein [Flavobacteriaceae bacterium FS1-H7996/R]